MKKGKTLSSFLLYFMIVAVFLSYSLFNKHGMISTKVDKDLTFIFIMVVACFVGYIVNFIIGNFFVGEFYHKLRISCNVLAFCTMIYVLTSNIKINHNLYKVLAYSMIIVLTYTFFKALEELDINNNVVFNVLLKSIFCLLITIEFCKLTNIFCGDMISRLYFYGFGVVEFFLLLSLLRHIPNAVFQSFAQNLIIKYCLGCFVYVYIKIIRQSLLKNNLIYIIEWGVVCIFFGIYFYNLVKNLKKLSYNSYEPLWGKHKRSKILIRNIEFVKLEEIIDLFIEKGQKTDLLVFLFNQLFMLNINSNDSRDIMQSLIEYSEGNLPKYSSKYKLKCIEDKNKNARFLVVESTIKKINGIMEEKI